MPHAPRPPGDRRHSSWCRPHSDLSLSLSHPKVSTCVQVNPRSPSPDLGVLPFPSRMSSPLLPTPAWVSHHRHLGPISASSFPKPSRAGLWEWGHLVLLPKSVSCLVDRLTLFLSEGVYTAFFPCQPPPSWCSRSEMDGPSTPFLLRLCRKKRSRSSEHKSNWSHKNRVMFPQSILPWSQFTEPEPLE